METYLFYATHLIMIACVAVVISAAKPENMQNSLKWIQDLSGRIAFLKNFKAMYRSIGKEGICIKTLIINILSIALQISAQLLK